MYGAATCERLTSPPLYNHYTYLADSFLHGRLDLVRDPPHLNDWAYFEGKWYVSFPPVPALLMIPGVALWPWDENLPSQVPEIWRSTNAPPGRYVFNQSVFVLFFTPFPPLLLFLILERLRKTKRLTRSPSENMTLCLLYAFGTVYFYTSVQNDTWHIAHVFGCLFLGLSLLASLEGRHPLISGLCLGLAFGCRTPMIFAFPFFCFEVIRHSGVHLVDGWAGKLRRCVDRDLLKKILIFFFSLSIPVLVWCLLNEARFGDPFEFGHRHLQVRWMERIEHWGLFDLHFLPKNLAAALVLMPWITDEPPYFQFSPHGMALWMTTPALFYLLWPKRRYVEGLDRPPQSHALWPSSRSELHSPLWICVVCVALPSLLYQNTGWIQFGYRFSNDYMMFFILLLAIGGRKMGRLFHALVVLSIAVNLFGAVTFNRVPELFNQDLSQEVFFQPDE